MPTHLHNEQKFILALKCFSCVLSSLPTHRGITSFVYIGAVTSIAIKYSAKVAAEVNNCSLRDNVLRQCANTPNKEKTFIDVNMPFLIFSIITVKYQNKNSV